MAVASALPETTALAELELFANVGEQELAAIREHVHSRAFPAGTTLLIAGQPAEVVYVVLEGNVKVCAEGPQGGETVFAILGPGDLLGGVGAADGGENAASAITLGPSRELWLERRTLWRLMEMLPAVACNFARILAGQLRRTNADLEALATLDVYGRIARSLLVLASKYGEAGANGEVAIPIHLTQNDLAGLVGASRVRVNQVLASYKRFSWISVHSASRIVIHNPAALANRCGHPELARALLG